ncbi:MAG: acyl carrier protein [Myxococcales bacterium]
MEIAQDIMQIVSRQLGVELGEVQEHSAFVDDLGADSLAIVELVLAIEDHFKIDIPEQEAERIRTVGDVVAYIKALKAVA